MSNVIVFKFKTKGPETLVKRGKSIEAKIYAPYRNRKEYQIEMNGCAFYRPTLEDALEYVRKSREDSFNALVSAVMESAEVKISMVQG